MRDVLDHKTRLLHAEISRMQAELSKVGAKEETVKMLCDPYYALLQSIYSEDYPLAHAIETTVERDIQ